MNTLNSEANESNKFIYQFTDKLNLKFLLQLGMMNLIYLMDLILFLIFKIILNTSSKNMKLLLIILLYKFISTI